LASSVTARLLELAADARNLAAAMAVINQRSPLPMWARWRGWTFRLGRSRGCSTRD
jgi:hypothetical protein